MKKLLMFFLVVGLITILGACGSGASSSSSNSQGSDHKGWPKQMTLVQMPNENNPSAGTAMYPALQKYLSKKLGIKVNEYQSSGGYAPGIEALASGKLDVMVASPMSYFQANKLAGADLLVTPQVKGQEYYTVFITKKDNKDINTISDLRGKSFAFVDAASSSGYLYPKATLVQKLKLNPDLVEKSGYFFKNVTFSQSHPNSVEGVVMGDYDAAAVAKGEIDSMIQSGTIKKDDIKIIGRTDNIPDATYIIRKNLPNSFKKAVRNAFVSFHNKAYFKAVHNDPNARFVATNQNFYDPALKMLGSIHALKGATK